MKITKNYLKKLIFEVLENQEEIQDVEDEAYAIISWNTQIEGQESATKKPVTIYPSDPSEQVIGQRTDYKEKNGWIIVRKIYLNEKPQTKEYFIPNQNVIINKKLENKVEAHRQQKLGNNFNVH